MDKSPEVPQDVLRRIFAILEIPDLVRAGSVCSSWRAAYTSLCSTGNCRLRQTPYLLYTSESTDAREAGLYSIAEKKAYTLTLPDPLSVVGISLAPHMDGSSQLMRGLSFTLSIPSPASRLPYHQSRLSSK